MEPFAPVAYSHLEVLPTDTMPWERLEGLLWRVAREVEGLRDVRIYGTRGQAQYGIDVVGSAADGSRHALQSKKYKRFTPADLTKAVAKFIRERKSIPFSIARLIVVTGCNADRTEVTDEYYRLRDLHTDVEIQFWDQRDLSSRLTDRPDIVSEFFGEAVARAFCSHFPPRVVPAPPVDRVRLADALTRGPAETTGADRHLSEAERLATDDPLAAVAELETASHLFEADGFAAHAEVVLQRRAELLTQAGERDGAARLLCDAFWETLEQHQEAEFETLLRQLRTTASTGTSQALCEIAEIARNLANNPLNDPPDIDLPALRSESTNLDVAQLLLLLARNACIDPSSTWRHDNLTELDAQASLVASSGKDGALLACHLRIEIADVTRDWADLLGQARRHQVPRDHAILIFARNALHHAHHGEPEQADASWSDALTQACLEGENPLAAEYVFAKKILAARYDNTILTDNHRLVRSLQTLGGTTPAERLEKKAMRAMLQGKHTEAVPLLRAFHRAAYSTGAWGDVDNARRMLADMYSQNEEPLLAVTLHAFADAPKKAAEVASTDPNMYQDMIGFINHPAPWVVAAAYKIIAVQADLVGDDQVTVISSAALAVLDMDRAGTLRRLGFGSSIFANAVKALSALASRLSDEQARRLLEHTRSWIPREPNRYSHTDNDHVRACASIARTNPRLRTDALDQLVALLDAEGSGVSDTAEHALANLGPTLLGEIHEHLTAMASTDNRSALRLLEVLGSAPTPERLAAAEAAAVTLATDSDASLESIGLMPDAPAQAVLARALPPDRRRELARTQLDRASAPFEPGLNRKIYYEAAWILVHDVEDVDDIHTTALLHARNRTPSPGDDSFSIGNHPLSSFRTKGIATDSRPQALRLAAATARTEAQKHEVRDLARTLVGSMESGHTDLAWALNKINLPATDSDIATLATQPHWPLRAIAAHQWANRADTPKELGMLLAEDTDPRVRVSLASALTPQSHPAAAAILQILAADVCHRVRIRAAA